MNNLDLAQQRLHTQHLAGRPLARPEDVVRWLTAVQAQDYPAAQWALGLRLEDARDSDVERAFADGTILRTHVLRPTWHFVTPDDIRWLLELTAPRVHALNAHYYRKLELDAAILARSNDLLANALEGGNRLTRAELGQTLEGAGIRSDGTLRLSYLVMHAELDGIICSGGRRGKQFTYSLLAECAPEARRLHHDEALAELAGRYFTAHGPATLKDFIWWSGLAAADAKAGLEMVKSGLEHAVVAEHDYWFASAAAFERDPSPTAYLLPNYDEYVIGYAVRDAVFEPPPQESSTPGGIYFGHMIVIDGRIVGAWKRTLRAGEVVVSAQTFAELSAAEHRAYVAAAERHGAFLGLRVVIA